jgi:multiple sugar transport system substrate-binding protein
MRLLYISSSVVGIIICGVIGAQKIHWHPPEDMLTVWLYDPPQEAELYKQLIADYRHQHPETRLRLENMPGRSITQKLLTGMDAGHAPDLCVLHWTWLPQVASTDQLLPLDDLVQRDGIDVEDYYPVGLQAYTYHEKLYGIPLRGSTITCFYNMDLFDQYGVAYPTDDWTWEELLEKAGKLTVDTDQDGLPDIYGCTPYDIANYVWSAGGDFLRWEDGRYVSNLDDPRVIEAWISTGSTALPSMPHNREAAMSSTATTAPRVIRI